MESKCKYNDILRLASILVLGFFVFGIQAHSLNQADLEVSSLKLDRSSLGSDEIDGFSDVAFGHGPPVGAQLTALQPLLKQFCYRFTGSSKDPVDRFHTYFLGHSPTSLSK